MSAFIGMIRKAVHFEEDVSKPVVLQRVEKLYACAVFRSPCILQRSRLRHSSLKRTFVFTVSILKGQRPGSWHGISCKD